MKNIAASKFFVPHLVAVFEMLSAISCCIYNSKES